MTSTPNLVRGSPFEITSSPKRRKLVPSPDNDSDDEPSLPLSSTATVPTQPLPTQSALPPYTANAYSSIPTQPLVPPSSTPPPQSSFVTQSTQPLPSQPLTPKHAPTVQVPASSPFQVQRSSPMRPAPPSQSIKPYDFYSSRPSAKPIQLDVDGPQYIGSSSEDEASQHAIKPVFGGAAQRPVPSVSAMHNRSMHSAPQTVPASPIPGGSFAQYAYKPPIIPQPPAYQKPKVGRLDSLSRRPGPGPSPALGAGISPLQRRPDPALPLTDLTLDQIHNPNYRDAVQRMKIVFPKKTYSYLLGELSKYDGNYDNAMEALTRNTTIDLTKDEDQPVAPSLPKTANRGAGAGKVAIKDKWSSTQAVRHDVPTTPQAAAPTRKRKLVRGSNRTSPQRSATPPPPPVILDDSDSEAEQDAESEDEREFEQKVLDYINGCTAKELSDFASTTEEIAETIVSKRPFKSIDDIREVSLTTATTGKKGKGRGRARPIGDKVVDVCLETMRGYQAVDALISKVEQLGKPIAESIKAWGVDVKTGTSAGELEMTDIMGESDSSSAKDSGIGTPTEDGDSEIKSSKRAKNSTFKQQPSNMREGVELKDYQLAGLNWLNLLYEKKLSCILADEMGKQLLTRIEPQMLIIG
jgi:SWI/SNF-related matrix-associated actin-dependent regulator 1 of chromatin subfamily A